MGAFSFSTIHFPPYNCGTRYDENDHWDDSNDNEAWHDDLEIDDDDEDENSFCFKGDPASDQVLCDDVVTIFVQVTQQTKFFRSFPETKSTNEQDVLTRFLHIIRNFVKANVCTGHDRIKSNALGVKLKIQDTS